MTPTANTLPAKTNFKIVVAFCSMLTGTGAMLTATTSYGYPDNEKAHQSQMKHRGPDFAKLATELELTAEQSAQLKTTLKSHRKEKKAAHQALRQKHKAERKEIRTSHKQELDSNLANFLTQEQIIKLHETRKKNKPHHPRKHGCEH